MCVKISIITATYNSAKTIVHCLESLATQTHQNFEHIITDGASTDETLQLIREHGVSDVVIDSQKDSGIYDALNRGIGMVSGDVVGFLHSDDYLPEKTVLADVARVFEDPSIDMCFGDLAYVSKLDTGKVVRRWRAGEFKRCKLRVGWMPPHPTLYVRREILQRHPFNLEYRISADYDSVVRLFTNENYTAKYLPEELVHMRLGGVSNKSLSNILLKMREDWRVARANKIGGVMVLVGKNLGKIPQFLLVN